MTPARYTLTATGHESRAPLTGRDLDRRRLRLMFEAAIEAGYTRIVCGPSRQQCAECGKALGIREFQAMAPAAGLAWCEGCA